MAPLYSRAEDSNRPTDLVVIFSSGGSVTTFTTTPISILTATTLPSTIVTTITQTPTTTRIFPDVFTTGGVVISSTFTDKYPAPPTTTTLTQVSPIIHTVTTFPASITVTNLKQSGLQLSLPTSTLRSSQKSSRTDNSFVTIPVAVSCSFLGFCTILLILYRRSRIRKIEGRTQLETPQPSETRDVVFHRAGETVLTWNDSQRPGLDVGTLDVQHQLLDKLTRERDASSNLVVPSTQMRELPRNQDGSLTEVEALRAQLTTIQSQLDAALAEGSGSEGELPPAYDYRASRQALNRS